MDRSVSIRNSVEAVQVTLAEAVVLVVLVIFLFLRNGRATIIPSLALPLSIVATFAVMWALGFSINNMTLLALVLCVGFVVDDAIVVLENIYRYVERGMPPFQAALKGSREIGFTILSMTLSLVAVFIPVLFMGGVVGRVFREFAVTISVAILVSGFVSLTLTPMLCARLLKPVDHKKKPGALFRLSERVFDSWLAGYRRSLDFVLRHRPATLAVTFATLVLAIGALCLDPEGLLPGRGHRLHLRHHRGGDRYLVPGHGRAPAAGRRDRAAGSRRRVCDLRRRRDLHQPHDEYRPPVHRAQAARPAQANRPSRSSSGCAAR